MKRIRLLFFLAVLLPFHTQKISAQPSQNMNLLSNWDNDALPSKSGIVYNDVWGYASGGKEYAIVGVVDSILFFDVTDPANPVEIDGVAGGARSLWRDMKSYQDYLYGVADQGGTAEGLLVIDMSFLPDSVHFVKQTTSFFSRAHNIFIDENAGRLYVAGSNTRSNGVIVLDVKTDPENPSQLSSVSLNGGYIHDLYARNDTIYCNHGNNGFYVYDIKNAGNPVELGSLTSYNEQGYNHACWLDDSGDNIVFTDETHDRGVKTVSVSDLSNIHVRDIFRSALLRPDDTASIAHNPIIKGNKIYLSYYHDGIQIWDMSDPDSVTRLGYYDTEPANTTYSGYKGAWGVYPLLPSGIILGTDIKNGLFVLEYAPAPLVYQSVDLTAEITSTGIRLGVRTEGVDIGTDWMIERLHERVEWKPLSSEAVDNSRILGYWVDGAPLPGWNTYRLRYHSIGGQEWKYSSPIQVYFPTSGMSDRFLIQQGDRGLNISSQGYEGPCLFLLFDLQGGVIGRSTHFFEPKNPIFYWTPKGLSDNSLYILKVLPKGEAEFSRIIYR